MLNHPMFEILKQKTPATRIAVVGATNNPAKYGNVIPKTLLRHGYTIWPVHPTEKEVLGLPCYPNITSLPATPDIVNIVTPPAITINVLAECEAAQVPNVWMQPGSFDDACVRFADTASFVSEHDACIMVVANYP